jgi:Ras-related protein Rab-2A
MSFAALDFWVESIRKASSEDIVIYLVGNKSDLALEDRTLRKVSKDNAIEFVKKNNLYHWTECSAKSNINIKDTFKSFYKSNTNLIYTYK